jgi:hypothetical protein
MLRGVEVTLSSGDNYSNPLQEGSEWNDSLRYLESWGFSLNCASKGALLLSKVSPESIAGSVGQIARPLGRICQVASLALSIESVSLLAQKGVLGIDLPSVKEIVGVAGKGVEVTVWLAKIDRLGVSFRVLSSLTSVGLAFSLMHPLLTLVIQLRDEGFSAFSRVECYKTSYKLGLALLSIYLFTSAVTLCFYFEAGIMGANFALSYL